MLFTLLAFAVALGTLITVHELGHYWVARRCGVSVLRFSVGFGKVLLRRVDRHGTEWALSVIPLGGYVKMQDDPPLGASAEVAAQALKRQPVGKRIAIVVAGPLANLILAVLLYAGLYMAGTEEPAAVVAQPAAETAAARAGFQEGDRLLAVAGKSVLAWDDARWKLLDVLAVGGKVDIEVQEAAGRIRPRVLVLDANNLDPAHRDPLAMAGLSLAAAKPVVRGMVAGSAGEQAGLRVGDVILRANGEQTPDAEALVRLIQAHAGQPLPLDVDRAGTPLTLTVVPRAEQMAERWVGRIGVQLGGDLAMVTVRYGPFDSLWRGLVRTGDTAWFSLRMMGRMLMGEVSWRNLSGPVTIADYAGQTARIGFAAYVAYLALISISLGVLNLLPIPLLDGGHLLYYFVEIVRGSPPPDHWIDIGQRAGIGLLAGIMGLALFNDFVRLFT